MVGTEEYASMQKKVGAALLILFAALIIFIVYFLIYYEKPCKDSQCFVDSMANCKRVYWIREDSQASWLYTIKGYTEGNACKVDIKLLKVKQGTLELESLLGKEMICVVQKGQTNFPEKDIGQCTGQLKEEIQELIIQRMHSYLLENFGEIKEEFKKV